MFKCWHNLWKQTERSFREMKIASFLVMILKRSENKSNIEYESSYTRYSHNAIIHRWHLCQCSFYALFCADFHKHWEHFPLITNAKLEIVKHIMIKMLGLDTNNTLMWVQLVDMSAKKDVDHPGQVHICVHAGPSLYVCLHTFFIKQAYK